MSVWPYNHAQPTRKLRTDIDLIPKNVSRADCLCWAKGVASCALIHIYTLVMGIIICRKRCDIYPTPLSINILGQHQQASCLSV